MATSTAQDTSQASRPWMKSDEIQVDMSSAPWLDVARAELGKKVHELASQDSFLTEMKQSMKLEAQYGALDQQLRDFGNTRMLADKPSNPFDPSRFSLGVKPLPDMARQTVGRMEAASMQRANPEIDKYFQGLKTDPSFDKKRRSFDLAPTYESDGEGRITAWCAAFVNWCLSQAGTPRLGYATAISWLNFGTPVVHPVPGCVTVVKPSKSTGSTTGHVAFFVRREGARIVLLGGNQGDAVSEVGFRESSVLGYRWPTLFNHYLAAGNSGAALA